VGQIPISRRSGMIIITHSKNAYRGASHRGHGGHGGGIELGRRKALWWTAWFGDLDQPSFHFV
jgi:hypothetical protein